MTGAAPLYLINLDRSPERLQRFQEWNRHLDSVVRVPAVDGAGLVQSELVHSGYVAPDANCNAGSLGCAMSHIGLWQRAIREDRALTILEDDVIVAHHFISAVDRLLSDLPADWDLVKWGWTVNLSALVEIGLSLVTLQGDGKPACRDPARLRSFQARATPVAPLRMLRSLGLFGYSISAKGARFVLEHCLPLKNRALESGDQSKTAAVAFDATLSDLYAKMQAFLCLPNLVVHADNGTSIRILMDHSGAPPPDASARSARGGTAFVTDD
jgi:GR25 family glycosyltransferase involved in LPS biosynthesis